MVELQIAWYKRERQLSSSSDETDFKTGSTPDYFLP
jgi:hypothetical protein